MTLSVWTTDLRTGRKLSHRMPMNIRSYTLALGAPTVIDGLVSLDAPVWPVPALRERRTALWVDEDDVLVAGGIVWTAEPDVPNHTLAVGCLGPLSYLARRQIRSLGLRYEQLDQFDMVRQLVDLAQSAPAGYIGLQVHADPAASGVQRDRSWPINKSFGDAIVELSQVENGFDLVEEFFYDADHRPQWALRLGYPFLGGVVPGILSYFEGAAGGRQGNIATYRWPADGGSSANSWMAMGAGIGSGQLVATSTDDTETDAGYPQLDGSSTYYDVVEPATLADHAVEDLRLALGSRVVPVLTLEGDHAPVAGQMAPGDFCRVRLTSSYHRPPAGQKHGLDAYLRVVKMKVTPASSTTDRTVELTMAPVSVGPVEVM